MKIYGRRRFMRGCSLSDAVHRRFSTSHSRTFYKICIHTGYIFKIYPVMLKKKIPQKLNVNLFFDIEFFKFFYMKPVARD
jgi:hypothetical protein